jgi:lipopolysaccharide/colanic/teichoic acid biosynthesis glycosyltransferase
LIEEKVALEKEYLLRKSFLLDVSIVVKTFTIVLFSKGVAY